MSEAIYFDGSSSTVVAIERWLAGEIYREPLIKTRDLRSFEFEGVTVPPGNYLLKTSEGIKVVPPEEFDKSTMNL